MQLSFWHKARYWVLLLVVLLIAISSHPTIVDMSRAAGLERGTILSRYIIALFGGLFLMCFNPKRLFVHKTIRVSLVMFFFIGLAYLMTFAVFGKRAMMSELRAIGICLVAIMVGWSMDLDNKRQSFLLVFFAGLTVFVGLMQVMKNIGGFEILDQYQTDNKNTLGVMLSSAAIVFLFLALNTSKGKLVKLLFLALMVFTFVVLLTIRARMSSLVTAMMVLFVLYERFKGKNFFFYLLFGLFVATVAIVLLPSSIKGFVYNSFFQNYEGGDITAGRSERNVAALAFLSDHLFLGNLTENTSVGQIHNYPLNKTFEYGLVFVMPIMVLYVYLFAVSIIKTIKSDNHNTSTIGYYLLLVPFVVSMAEPSFPFGPGTATVFNFIFFGMALKHSCEERHNTELLSDKSDGEPSFSVNLNKKN